MNWEQLLGHDTQQNWFRSAFRSGRLASSFLFVGPEGIGKRSFALLLAKSLLCRQTSIDELNFCGSCEDCVQVEASTHPDLIQISKPADRADIPLKLLIGEGEKRMREGLCYDISLRPYGGRRKIAILDDVDYLNAEGANCLLKTLEEPPSDSVLFLIGSSLQRQLPTIRSRCQSILFRPLSGDQIVDLIRAGAVDSDDVTLSSSSADELQQLASEAKGSLAKARLIANSELREFRKQLESMLLQRRMPATQLIKEVSALVDAAGKEARARRDRMKLVFEMSAGLYRDLCLKQNEQGGQSTRLKAYLKCWNRCLSAISEVDRNANQAALIESWSFELAALGGN